MKRFNSLLTIQAAILAAAMGMCEKGWANMMPGISLDAQSVVNSFNSMNGGSGIHFDTSSYPGFFFAIRNMPGYNFADTGAYIGNGAADYFYSLCVEPDIPGPAKGSTGKLNYSDGKTQTANGPRVGSSLTVGAAYLYTMFSTSQISGTFTNNSMRELGAAIRFLVGDLYPSESSTNWRNNKYLNELLGINSSSYWQSIYDPNAYYSEIGNFSIFVVNTEFNGKYYQDFLYLANAVNPYIEEPPPGVEPPSGTKPPSPGTSEVPEPAAWSLFALGLTGISITRRFGAKTVKSKKSKLGC
ncbi:MAG: PEP-CTERM sorting domain-containing protein [Candidatus Accumulibacter sp.]|nr:PEP-CTERM sorting domain-containing protein [Accumulibacter sp.]